MPTAPMSAANPQHIIAMCGLVASGKSTVARALAQRIDAALIVADDVRLSLLGHSPLERTESAVLTKNYSSTLPKKVYDQILAHTQTMLAAGHSVVVDACFHTRASRAALRKLATDFQVPLLFVECRAPQNVINARLAARAARDGVSLHDWREIAKHLQADWQEITETTPHEHAVADTSQPLDTTVSKLCRNFLPTLLIAEQSEHD